jgi:diguanylate cyclase (GGDEF)-like protein/PAS domain S-box-containing protein
MPDRKLVSMRYMRAWLVLLACLLATGYASYYARSVVDSDAQRQFAFDCDEILLKIEGRLQAQKQVLLGAAALFDASESIERDEWHAYAKRMQIDQHFNGIQGLGFSLLISKDRLARHIAEIRKQGFPEYTVHPEGEREVYSSIIYLEPFAGRNLRAFGYDMYAESVRRAAMAQARDGNMASLSDKVTLAQETASDVQAGTLMYMPVYRKLMPVETIEQRRAALYGWVYSPFRMDDMLAGVLKDRDNPAASHLHLQVYDGHGTDANSLLYNSEAMQAATTRPSALFTLERHMSLLGNEWTLHFTRADGSASDLDYSKAWLTLAGGLGASLLLFLLMLSYLDTRRNAARIAAELTTELRNSARELALHNRILNQISVGMSLPDVLNELVQQVEAMHPGMQCAIFLLDEAGKHLRCGAAPSLPVAYIKAVEELAVSDGGGSCGTAAYRGERVIVEDVQQHPYWESLCGLLSQTDIRSCWSEPIKDNAEHVFGTFSVYRKKTARPSDTEIVLMERYAKLAALVIERIRIQDDLRLKDLALNAAANAVVITDNNARIKWANQAFSTLTGYSVSEAIGQRMKDLLKSGMQSHPYYEQLWQAIISGQVWRGELVNRHKDGTLYHEEMTITPVLNGLGEITHYVAVKQDITQRKANETKVQRITNLYAALSQCNEAIVRCASEDELFPQICRIAVESGGMKMAWIGLVDEAKKSVMPVASYGDGVEYLQGMQIPLDANDPSGRGPTGTAIRENQPFWCQDFLHDPVTAPWHERGLRYSWGGSASLPLQRNGVVIGSFTIYADEVNAFDVAARKLLVEMAIDISYALDNFARETERKRAEERIQQLVHFDQLTGLPNQALFADRIKHALSTAQHSRAQLAILFLDLDHFKNINDTLGHRIGDELLVEVAKRLRSAVREEDTVSRQGGDEFVLVLPDTDADGAAHAAEKLLAVFARACQIEQHELNVTTSIGIAMYPSDGEDFESLYKCADVAMYRAKHDGRNNYRFFTQEMQSHSARTLQLENALRHAQVRGELQLHYQPQVSLQDGRIIGAEALLRWQHPELGTVAPAEFIPIAEANGQILQIGEWVMRSAVHQLKTWMDSGLAPMIIAVNLSAVQFRHPHLPGLVTQILEEAKLAPQYLELELTEGVAMDDPLEAIAVMDNLHERGVRMSIDDFGTGYSSLSYLKRFQVYKLKIDQSFVRDITEDPEDKAIVAAIISLANSLGMQTIAEGVETAGQLAFLRLQGCNEVQGYYFSKPLPAGEFEAYVREKSVA